MSSEMPADKTEHDYYELLQVHPKATLAVIKKAYRTLLLEEGNHPDRGGDSRAAALITEAYAVLSDPERRAAYDRRYFSRHAGAADERAAEPASASPPASGLIVLCPRCRTKNRVRSQELLSVAVCSRCGQSLNRLPNVFLDASEHARAAWAGLRERLAQAAPRPTPRAPQATGAKPRASGQHAPFRRPLPATVQWGLPLALLALSLVVGVGALWDTLAPGADPLEATERLKREGHLDQAAVRLQRALEREPGNPRLHEKLGDVYAKQGLDEQALAEYGRAIAFNPQNSYLYTLEGDSYLKLSRLNEAEESYRRALKLDPQQSPALVALGNVRARQRRFEEAAKLYQQALRERPSADVFYNLAMVLQWDARPDEARHAYLQALVADPNHRASMVNLASLYYEAGEYDLAAAQLIKASALKHQDLDLHLKLADIYTRTGHTREAIREWQTCLDQGKDNPVVRERARRALERLGATEES